MRGTIARLVESAIRTATDIRTDAERLDDGDSLAAANCALLLADAQAALNKARDAVCLAMQQNAETRNDD